MPRTFTAVQSYQFVSSPKEVFRALTEPARLVKWFLSGAKVELRTGGAFAFDWLGGYHMESTLTRFRSGRSVGFLWVDRLPSGKLARTRAEFQVTKKGRGTILRLRHSGFRDPEHFAECSSRWAYYLTNLKSVLDHRVDLRSPHDW
ncbi:MAG TPA: SRPBCC domain-containing protein [Thermoplasmata archaeon]|nr:SRPBCC domain-containing protein [Thermoplasmata archaeon]